MAKLSGIPLSEGELRSVALRSIFGVGVESVEWAEPSRTAYHLRRRLTPAECEIVGPVLDLRRSMDRWVRLHKVCLRLPPQVVSRVRVLAETEFLGRTENVGN